MKTRSELLESIYEIKNSDKDNADADKLLYDILLGKCSPEDAYIRLKKIDPNFKRYTFLEKIKEKPVYKSIQSYKNGTLSDISTAKMIASLITQVLIQYENDNDLTPDKLQINDLLEVIAQYSNEGQLNHDLIDHIIDNYGFSSNNGESEVELRNE